MFNLLGQQFSGRVVDLFAGSGALGLEALSRGARSAVFIDKDAGSAAVIRENIARLAAEPGTTDVWRMDWRRAWQRIEAHAWDVEWVFVDPPYPLHLWEPVLQVLSQAQQTVPGGVVCEHPKTVRLPAAVGQLEQIKQRVYGDIAVSVYRRREETARGEDV